MIYFDCSLNRWTMTFFLFTSCKLILFKLFIRILHVSNLSIEWDKETSEFNKNRGILHLFFTLSEQKRL
ncbi:Regulator of V-ATPase in vacuolar membrane protein [Trichinella pseudospiralis]